MTAKKTETKAPRRKPAEKEEAKRPVTVDGTTGTLPNAGNPGELRNDPVDLKATVAAHGVDMDRTTSPLIASLAGRVLNGYTPNPQEIASMAASLLSQAAELDAMRATPAPAADEPVEPENESVSHVYAPADAPAAPVDVSIAGPDIDPPGYTPPGTLNPGIARGLAALSPHRDGFMRVRSGRAEVVGSGMVFFRGPLWSANPHR